MEVIINRKEFLNAISIGGGMAGKNSVTSMLSNVKFMVKNGVAKVISTDNEVYISHKLNVVSHNDEINVCIDVKDLTNAIKSANGENITMVFSNNNCDVVYNKGKITIPYTDSQDFPKPVMESSVNKHFVDSEKLFNWLKEARNFTCDDSLRPVLSGVNIIIGKNRIGVVATDATSLYYDYDDHEYTGEEVEAIITNKAVNAALSILNETENISIAIGEKNIILTGDNSILVVKKIEGKFPNFKSIIPNNNNITVTADKSELKESFNRGILFANQASKLIKLNIDCGEIMISATDSDFGKGFIETCKCNNTNDEPITIGINGKLINACIDAINSDVITINMSQPSRPIVFKDEIKPNKVVLLMPMML